MGKINQTSFDETFQITDVILSFSGETTTQLVSKLGHTVDALFLTYFCGLMIALSLIAFVANPMIIAATLITPSLRTVTNYYIIALAVADVLGAFFHTLYTFGSFNPPLIRLIGEYRTFRFKMGDVNSLLFVCIN